MIDERRDELLAAARGAAERAYAPYSEYRVGAAILTSSGEIVTGCNVENSSYGLTVCAERNAIAAAVCRGLVERADLAAVAIHSSDGPMPWPCGACRQVLREFGHAELAILVDGREGAVESTLGELFPHAFLLGER